jgi:WD repeat-containing protein 35
MEKTKISFVRGTATEEAVPCSGYICDYNNLQVKVVMLDEIMKMHLRGVQAPSSDYITIYDNKVKKKKRNFIEKILSFKLLRDMKSACEKLPLEQVSSLIEKDPHPQLWYEKKRIRIKKSK